MGEGTNKVDLVEALVSKLYIPRSTVAVMRGATANQDFRYGSDDLIPAAPRIFPEDPPGYSPIVWLHDVVVPADPPYVFGSYKKLSDIDPPRLPRATPPPPSGPRTSRWPASPRSAWPTPTALLSG